MRSKKNTKGVINHRIKATLIIAIISPVLFWVWERWEFTIGERLFMLAVLWIILNDVFKPIKRVRSCLMEKMEI